MPLGETRNQYLERLKRDFNDAQKKIAELEEWKECAAKQLAERQDTINNLNVQVAKRINEAEERLVKIVQSEQATILKTTQEKAVLVSEIERLSIVIDYLLIVIAPTFAKKADNG